MNKFDNELIKVLSAYNAGEGTVQTWINADSDNIFNIEDIKYNETKNYVDKVLKSQYYYEKLYKLE